MWKPDRTSERDQVWRKKKKKGGGAFLPGGQWGRAGGKGSTMMIRVHVASNVEKSTLMKTRNIIKTCP